MLYFLVYNDDTHHVYMDPLVESVKQHGKQFEIIIFNKSDMESEFVENHRHILDLERGGGYWLWKPYIVYKTLTKLNDDDILFYLDSKYYFIEDFVGLYDEFMKHNDLLVWKNKPNEPIWYMKNWCKMDVIRKFDMYDKVFNGDAEDCWGGALIVKKNENGLKYMKEWLDMCCVYENITDSPSIEPNDPLFRDHRHDQSMLSIVLHKYNIPMQFFETKYLQNLRARW